MRNFKIIIFLFIIVFTLGSLLSYSSSDPSGFNPVQADNIHNLFGISGSSIAGLLMGLFGFGAFWIPPVLLYFHIHFYGKTVSKKDIILRIAGAVILLLATGSFFAIWTDHYAFIGLHTPSGGIIGTFAASIITRYLSWFGGAVIFLMAGLTGFFLTAGMPLAESFNRIWIYLKSAGKHAFTMIMTMRISLSKKTIRLINPLSNKTSVHQTFEQETDNENDSEIQEPQSESLQAEKKRKKKKTVLEKAQLALPITIQKTKSKMPPLTYLAKANKRPPSIDRALLKKQSGLLESKLEDFGVKGKVSNERPGPVITTFEYKPAPGVKINKIVNLADDLALTLEAISIRIVAPIPGKAVIGIEIPNKDREIVKIKEIVDSDVFKRSKSNLTLCLGKDIVGNPVVAQLDKMPHLLIAGATGTGKSVCLNTMISSFLYKAEPEDVKLIMIDPKRIELSLFEGIPHLITPVVTDVKKATNALFWTVNEMERRYKLLAGKKVRNIIQYNRKAAGEKIAENEVRAEKLPYIVVIIDELADLMMVASRDVEASLMRLAQMARAAGIHLILATQRPSVNVLTGVIKANFPTRLTFQVSSKTDSRTIIDSNGAERLLGNGDMLFLPPGTGRLQRIHGAYISEEELIKITEYLKNLKEPEYDNSIIQSPIMEDDADETTEYDARYDDAVALVTKAGQASISMVQRHLRIGYNRAARIIEVMEKEGVVGPADGAKPRKVLVQGYDDIP